MASSARKLYPIMRIEPIDLHDINLQSFTRSGVGCIVLTQDNQILLQHRDADAPTYPNCLATFGGGIEAGETPMQALIRELHEELGAEVKAADVVSLGAITEAITQYRELSYVYFWHDKNGTITGCYEGQARHYENYHQAMKHPNIMDDVVWLLIECSTRHLL
jgi:8-oxo-dGTP diphosphatase